MEEKKSKTDTWNRRYGLFLTAVVFLINFISLGTPKCFTLFYLELLENYDTSATTTGWLIGVQNQARLSLGIYYFTSLSFTLCFGTELLIIILI